ncbi:mannan-binding lectin serine protease 1 isoform X2 [Protopterus annectens]|uniref:mannan-binding lectin serine protease 1 isoform X2 n=1 Tax=Protopterus annectens TaxID=7888 RepID=UPI001CFAF6BE|nr:mannan-binding lectin serine protease 1 isoform X2 [Protopterus annectens]
MMELCIKRFLITLVVYNLILFQSNAIELKGMFGEIRSPNFPEGYPRDSNISWNISVPDGFRVKLYFSHFDLEPSYLCEYDYVKIEADGQVLGTFCGQESTDTEQIPGQQMYFSPAHDMTVTFISDFSNEERFTGFDAHFAAVDVDECKEKNDEELACDHYCHNYIGGFYCSCRFGYILHTDNRTCRVECSDNLFTERSGIISSPDFPNPYPKSSDCLYRIELEEGFVINLMFEDSFDIEDHPEVMCPYDYVKIKAGRKEFGPICGDRSPRRIETGSYSVQILFHSDNSGENGGWRLSYDAVGTPCPVPQPPVNGKIEPSLKQYSFKDQVLITCDTGYNMIKDNLEIEKFQIVCQKDGSWSSVMPTCRIVDCQTPPILEHGYVEFNTRNNLSTYQSQIEYFCQQAFYQIVPNITSIYTCQENKRWMNKNLGAKLPTCLPVCGIPAFSRTKLARIAGGKFAERGMSPWIAMLSRSGSPFCGGSLIGDNWIVTAAHCLHNSLEEDRANLLSSDIVDSSSFKIILGKHRTRQQDNTEQSLQAKNIILHPQYNFSTYSFDIALLELNNHAILNNYVKPVCLPDEETTSTVLHEGDMVIVSGWGKQFLQKLPDSLAEIEIPVVDHSKCKESYAKLQRSVTDDMICAGEKEGGKDSCQGDSGGPMVTINKQTKRWFLAATVSWGVGCAQNEKYGVYSNVQKSLSWIKTVTGIYNV